MRRSILTTGLVGPFMLALMAGDAQACHKKKHAAAACAPAPVYVAAPMPAPVCYCPPAKPKHKCFGHKKAKAAC